MAMENLPSFVEHTTGPLTFWGAPPMMTFVSPAAAGVLGDVGAGLVVGAGEVAAPGDGLDASSSLEHPAALAIMVAAPTAINNSRFTGSSF
ncbi:hypothetical protein [Mycobacterium decipiens]|uniref:hypothetical protein n=1 Tax=Mycobacterium decipiens TaxID=1430326 RepID=UPI001F620AFC|nr:hypothetical protein [Mycobacterium decipiens]